MKFSLIAASVLAATFAEAAIYTTSFTNTTTARSCMKSNIGYLLKVTGSSSLLWNADTITLTSTEECHPVVLQEIYEVCGNTVDQNCA